MYSANFSNTILSPTEYVDFFSDDSSVLVYLVEDCSVFTSLEDDFELFSEFPQATKTLTEIKLNPKANHLFVLFINKTSQYFNNILSYSI